MPTIAEMMRIVTAAVMLTTSTGKPLLGSPGSVLVVGTVVLVVSAGCAPSVVGTAGSTLGFKGGKSAIYAGYILFSISQSVSLIIPFSLQFIL